MLNRAEALHVKLAEWQKVLEDRLAETIDTGQEPISPQRQLAAYRTMTDAEKEQKRLEWGDGPYNEWMNQMEGRIRQSNEKRVPNWEEVLGE